MLDEHGKYIKTLPGTQKKYTPCLQTMVKGCWSLDWNIPSLHPFWKLKDITPCTNCCKQFYFTTKSTTSVIIYCIPNYAMGHCEKWGEIPSWWSTTVIPNRVDAMKRHGSSLWKWPIKEDHIFYFNHNVVKAIEPPEMQNMV